MANRCSNFNACCLLSCRNNSTLNCCLSRPTVTLHHGQGHQNEHEQKHHAYIYRHAKFECHSLNTVREMAIIVQVKHLSSLGRSCGPSLKSEVIGLRKDYIDL